jgi:ribosomal-protein-alanine N-acetyltransferase
MSAVLKDPLLRLRPMSDEDVEAVIEVERASYPYPWTAGIFRDCLRVGYCCWMCTLDEMAIGHGVISVAAGECHVLNVCIHPQWQGHGLGRKMLRHLLNLGRRHRADTAFLEVRASNAPAIGLYHAEGFNEVSRRRDYYPGGKGREDALVFAKDLRW